MNSSVSQIGKIVATALRDAGFLRVGRKKVWWERHDKVTRIIAIDRAPRSGYTFIDFGVYFREVGSIPKPETFSAGSGHIVGRAQAVMSRQEADRLNDISKPDSEASDLDRKGAFEHALAATLRFLRSFHDFDSYKRMRGQHTGVLELAAISKVLD